MGTRVCNGEEGEKEAEVDDSGTSDERGQKKALMQVVVARRV